MQSDKSMTPQPDIKAAIEHLEQLEGLLLLMISTDLSAIAPASRASCLSLAYTLASNALSAANGKQAAD